MRLLIYLSVFVIVCLLIYLFIKQAEIVKYIPITHKGVINLYNVMSENDKYTSLYKIYFNIILLFLFIVLMSIVLKLNILFTITLIIISLLLIPLVILWRLNYYRQEYEFNNLIIYLNQFIMVFKSYPKVYPTLIEIENTVTGELSDLVNICIDKIKDGESSQEALLEISNKYPHFILFNLHSLAYNIEQYGTPDYFEALDLIQDDIDDWSEDVNAYNHDKARIINKVSFLIFFAFGICFMALKMLFAIDMDLNNNSYQISIFLFCLLQIFTYVSSLSVINTKWLESSETL